MTIKGYRLLKKLKKAQTKEKDIVYISYSDLTASRVIETGNVPSIVGISKYENSLRPTLKYLRDSGYVHWSEKNEQYVWVTHAGWHFEETVIQKVLSFLIKSVAVPIVVAFITALLTTILLG